MMSRSVEFCPILNHFFTFISFSGVKINGVVIFLSFGFYKNYKFGDLVGITGTKIFVALYDWLELSGV